MITMLDRPALEEPLLVAGWPGMGFVASKAVGYLVEQLAAAPLASVDIPDLHQLKGVSVACGMIEPIHVPRARVFSCRRPAGGGRDLVVFVGDEQPVAGKELLLSRSLVETGRELGCREVVTFAAMVTGTAHTEVPQVWGCSSSPAALERMRACGVQPLAEGQISGLNGVLAGVAAAQGLTAVCLLGEVPFYATQIPYYAASSRVLGVFARLYGVDIPFEKIDEMGLATRIEIDSYLKRAREEELLTKEEKESLGELRDPAGDSEDGGGEDQTN